MLAGPPGAGVSDGIPRVNGMLPGTRRIRSTRTLMRKPISRNPHATRIDARSGRSRCPRILRLVFRPLREAQRAVRSPRLSRPDRSGRRSRVGAKDVFRQNHAAEREEVPDEVANAPLAPQSRLTVEDHRLLRIPALRRQVTGRYEPGAGARGLMVDGSNCAMYAPSSHHGSLSLRRNSWMLSARRRAVAGLDSRMFAAASRWAL